VFFVLQHAFRVRTAVQMAGLEEHDDTYRPLHAIKLDAPRRTVQFYNMIDILARGFAG
jgi:hypothetical protein